jgi:hypothetical protein
MGGVVAVSPPDVTQVKSTPEKSAPEISAFFNVIPSRLALLNLALLNLA